MPLPQEFEKEFAPVFSYKRTVGTLSTDSSISFPISPVNIDDANLNLESGSYNITLPSHCSKGLFTSQEMEGLKNLYSRLYSSLIVLFKNIRLYSSMVKRLDAIKADQKIHLLLCVGGIQFLMMILMSIVFIQLSAHHRLLTLQSTL